MRRGIYLVAALAMAFMITSCGDSSEPRQGEKGTAAPPTNRIRVPADVERNLGITWAKARLGRLEHRVSIPGEIVGRPGHSWTIRAPFSGTVSRIGERWGRVRSGEIVAEIVSSELAETQAGLFAARERAEQARLDLRGARAEVEPQEALAATLARVAAESRESVARVEAELNATRLVAKNSKARLAEVERLRKTDAVSSAVLLAAQRESLELSRDVNEAERALRTARIEADEQSLRAATARVTAEDAARRIALLTTRLASVEAAFQQSLRSLAAACGLTPEVLSEVEDETPRWARLQSLPLRAPAEGVIVEVRAAAGTWADRNDALLEILDPRVLTFSALIPEADAFGIPKDATVKIEAPGLETSVQGELLLIRPVADARTRSVLLEAAVKNPEGVLRVGTSARGLVATSMSKSEEVLVPLLCVVRDGLQSVVFRRDPADAHQVIRTVVTLGASSGDWVEVIAGAGVGDEIVQTGAHQLQQTGLGKASGGGHFHADGTFHEGDK